MVYRGKTEEKWRWRDLRKIPGNYTHKWSKDILPRGHWERRPATWLMSEKKKKSSCVVNGFVWGENYVKKPGETLFEIFQIGEMIVWSVECWCD